MARENITIRAHALSIPCTDRKRSDQFYREVLGAVRDPRPEDAYTCKWYRLGTLLITLVPSAVRPATCPQDAMPMLWLEVDDFRAVHAHFVKHGANIVNMPNPDDGYMMIADPDGLLIEVWQADLEGEPKTS